MRIFTMTGALLIALSNIAFGANTLPSEDELKLGYNPASNTCQGRPITRMIGPEQFTFTKSVTQLLNSTTFTFNQLELKDLNVTDQVTLIRMPSDATGSIHESIVHFIGKNVIACVVDGDLGGSTIISGASSAAGTYYYSNYMDLFKLDSGGWSSIAVDFNNTRTWTMVVGSINLDQLAFLGTWTGISDCASCGGSLPDNSAMIIAQGGDDIIFGSQSTPAGMLVWGGAGNDSIHGSAGSDIIYGEMGDDWIEGYGGGDDVYGGAGDDVLMLGSYRKNNGKIEWSMKDGSESGTIWINTYADKVGGYISGDDGNDILWGTNGKDILEGGEGNDHMFGLSGDDNLYGNRGDDWIFGMSGNDVISGAGGNDHTFNNNSSTDGTIN